MRIRIPVLSGVVVAGALLLTGCVFSPGAINAPTVPADDVATTAEDALEEQVGQRPEIDCGDEPIHLVVDAQVTCLLIDPVAGLEFDTVLTFTAVSGTDYEFDIAVADVANNAPEPTVEPDPGGGAPTVPGEAIAALAIEALTPVLGFVPEISCDAAEVEIFVGSTADCSYSDADGDHAVEVTVTQFDGETYVINAKVLD